jgi:cobyrinic acid a,c-diamide synthase
MLKEALPCSLRWLGHIPSTEEIELPDRHLGLHQADEIHDLDARIDRAADALASTGLVALPPPVEFSPESDTVASEPLTRLMNGVHIAVARDAAFSFIYPANLAFIKTLGAQVTFFSPLANEAVPGSADAVYLPGGYPELHAAALALNRVSAASIRAHAAGGKRIVAECGGMLYLLDALVDVHGATTPMLGLIPGRATMQKRFAALGMQRLTGPVGAMTGHAFHYSLVETPLAPVMRATQPDTGAAGEAVFQHGAVIATYMHGYWPSNPAFAAALFVGDLEKGGKNPG